MKNEKLKMMSRQIFFMQLILIKSGKLRKIEVRKKTKLKKAFISVAEIQGQIWVEKIQSDLAALLIT